MSARAASDRLNPVLLKELRQALRSRAFGVLFPTCVAVATTFAIVVLMDSPGGPQAGRAVFLRVFALLELAALGLVPFSAFQSMAGEWDEGTHDLLVLADLHPARVLLGKLLTSAVEAALYFAAFVPLLLFTFLLRGVDVRDVLFLVALLYLASLSMCALAFTAAGLTRVRLWRVVLLATVALVGLGAGAVGISVADDVVGRGRGLGAGLDAEVALGMVSFVLGVGAIAFTFAATRLAHAEDDRSSLPRLAVTAALVALLVWAGFLVPTGGTQHLDEIGSAVVLCASIPFVGFATEAEALPRRVRLHVPRRPLVALLCAPFLPGGGRGVLLFLVHLGLVFLWACTLDLLAPGSATPFERAWWGLGLARWLAFSAYFVIYVAGLSLLLRRLCASGTGRLVARITIPAAVALSILLPALFGFLVGDDRWASADHPLNPIMILGRSLSGPAGAPAFAFFERIPEGARMAVLLAALTLVASAPRLVRAVGEVLAASRARRAQAPARGGALGRTAHAG